MRLALAIGFLVVMSLGVISLIRLQPAGTDFLALWAGGKVAGLNVSRLYDFSYVTGFQAWPLGADMMRPFVYPPSMLLVFAPLSGLPFSVAYGLWTALTALLLGRAGRRFGAPLWFMLFPWIAFAAYAGQVSFLLLALILFGLTERASRPLLAGALFGMAAALKPQLLILLPVALLAEQRYRTILAAGASGLAVCALSAAIWGLGPWLEWVAALPRFTDLLELHPTLVANSITPYGALVHFGMDGRWAYLLAPFVAAGTWIAFRRGVDPADQLIVLLGGAMLISPYAMHYELALLAPACAIYLSRTQDRPWIGYLACVAAHSVIIHPALIDLLAVLALPVLRASWLRQQRGADQQQHAG